MVGLMEGVTVFLLLFTTVSTVAQIGLLVYLIKNRKDK